MQDREEEKVGLVETEGIEPTGVPNPGMPETDQPPQDPGYQAWDAEPEIAGMKDLAPAARMGFVRKVYGILTCQLLLTFGAVSVACAFEWVRIFMKDHWSILIVALVVNMMSLYALGCYPTLARTVPINFILITIFTVTEAYCIAFITAYYSPETVFIAAALTAGVVVA